MLPSPKDCTACGGTHNTEDDPLMLYCWRTGVAVGWVHKGCRGRLLDGMRAMDDHARDHIGLDVPDRDPAELWHFRLPH